MHPGWDLLLQVINAQVKLRTQRVLLTPLDTLDGALGQEFQKGEISGLSLAVALPAGLINEAQEASQEEHKNVSTGD